MKTVVHKPSSVISIKAVNGDLKLVERKIWGILFAHCYEELRTKDKHTMPIRTLLAYFNDNRKDYDRMEEYVKNLNKVSVEYNLLNKDKGMVRGIAPLLAGTEFDDNNITYSFSPILRDRLLEDKRIYATISILITQKFRSKYAFILYELGIDYIDAFKFPRLPVEEFRDLMSIKDKQYPRFNDMNLRVIQPALKEINKKSDLKVTLKTIREGRSIKFLDFTFEKKKTFQEELPLEMPTEKQKLSQIKEIFKSKY